MLLYIEKESDMEIDNMIDYIEYIEKLLKKNVQDNYLSSLLTYESKEGEVSVFDLIEAYYSMLDDVKREIEYYKDGLGEGLETKVSVLFKDMNITDVVYVENDDSYVFSLEAKTPVSYNIGLRLRRLNDNEETDGNERNSRGELIIRDNANNYSDYEFSVVNDNSINTLGFMVAILFYENMNDELFALLEKMANSYYKRLTYYPKVDSNVPIKIELYNGEIVIRYAGSNNQICICEIDEYRNLHMADDYVFKGNCEELFPLANDPFWFLNNIYVSETGYMKDVLSEYYHDGNCILDTILLKAGYGDTTGFKNEYCDADSYLDEGERYYIRSERNKLQRIRNYISVHRNEDGTYTFEFLDGSILTIPADEVTSVVPQENNSKPLALLALKEKL